MNIINEVKQEIDNIISYRRYFHSNPELSFQEYNTTKYIEAKLNEFGIENFRIIETGVIGIIGKISDNCIALRADIDALPIQEETGLEFASKTAGNMHACGHDMHIAMLLGAAKILKQNESQLNGCVKLIFQPAEELIPGGAYLMIQAGVLENPTPRYVFGQHINPSIETGKIATCNGPIMASADELYWTIKGKSSHAATPHLGNDPILASAQMINNLQSIITKFRDPLDSGVISITSIHGGSATNILPEEVKLMGTLRAYNESWRYKTIDNIKMMSESISEMYNCTCEFNPKLGFPSVNNDEKAVNYVKSSALALQESDKYFVCKPMMWAEDFAYYGQKVPSAFWFLGVKNTNNMPALHNNHLAPDENAMLIGTAMLVSLAINSLAEYRI